MPRVGLKHHGAFTVFTALVYYFSNPKPGDHYDYTFRVAEQFLRGSTGFAEKPPYWLNEFVLCDGIWYSVFPFGSVVSMVPFAFLKVAGAIQRMPSALLCTLLAAAICLFLLKIGSKYELPKARIVLTTAGVLFGTFMWANLTMGGAWQLALGFAMVGQLGAIYFTVYDRRPLVAGAFFALAFGNRTEIILTAPIFLFLLSRNDTRTNEINKEKRSRSSFLERIDAKRVASFCGIPLVLGVSTLIYNYIRFHSISDFGYARIPGVLDEPWYDHGIFSFRYIPRQAWEMLFKPWEFQEAIPYLVPDGFSSSILLSSPFILFSTRLGARDRVPKYSAWAAIVVMTLLLWMHGNSGGWQFGYRYWMVCLPWLFVILLESSPTKISRLEWAAYIFSFLANLYATWLFHWTSYLKP